MTIFFLYCIEFRQVENGHIFPTIVRESDWTDVPVVYYESLSVFG